MSLEAASLIFSGISALSDVIDLYRGPFQLQQHQGPQPEQQEQQQEQQQEEEDQSSPVTLLFHLIDSDLLDVMARNIDEAKSRLLKALADPANSNQAKEHEVAVASATICSQLSIIRRLNDGKLPHPEFIQLWASHGCN